MNDVVTFGCRLNTYESEVMREHALAAGLSDVIVFNTCAVTAEAERQARQAIRKARRERPEATIVVTGCAAQIRPESFAQMPEVDLVLGNEEKMKPESFTGFAALKARGEKALVNDIMSVRETASHLVGGMEGRARAFIQVQNGCNHRCTFCIIPYGRGNSRSVPVGEVVAQVRKLVEAGYNEIVLTGVDVSDYGKDLPGAPTLGQMMRRVLSLVPELPRLRLSSIDAAEVDGDLLELLATETRLMPHLHVSLQAGDDMILKRMKRRHLRRDILEFCARLRAIRPDIVFGADLIAGFPTETEEMFAHTRDLVREAGITWLHVFPFSPREGTPAARMPQLPRRVVKERAALLRADGEIQVRRYLESCLGKEVNILLETPESGRTEGFAQVSLAAAAGREGDVIKVQIQHVDGNSLRAAAIA